MSRPPLVPPLKCQGIKTKLVSAIQKVANTREYSRWIEPFCGSGTQIVAAERAVRRCFAMELDPVYCDVAVRRWEMATGQRAARLDGA
jgi:23S rRNA G2445 N2-methylase RlmL